MWLTDLASPDLSGKAIIMCCKLCIPFAISAAESFSNRKFFYKVICMFLAPTSGSADSAAAVLSGKLCL